MAALKTSVASGDDPQELEDPSASLRLQVWENVGFPVTHSSPRRRGLLFSSCLRHLYESHTSAHLAEKLQEVVAEWKLERPGTTISVTTDNAKNSVNAVSRAGSACSML